MDGPAFRSIGGHSRGFLAALDAATGLATGWDPEPSGPISALAAGGTVVYAGGDFTSIGNLAQSYLATTAATILAAPEPAKARLVSLLRQNVPNPFRAGTTVRFVLAAPQEVTVRIYDLAGREVATLLDGERRAPGEHVLEFDGRGLPSGVYLCRLRAGAQVETRRMTLLR